METIDPNCIGNSSSHSRLENGQENDSSTFAHRSTAFSCKLDSFEGIPEPKKSGGSGSFGLTPAIKTVADFYESDSRAVEDLPYNDVTKAFPMLCYCDPNVGDGKTCPCQPGGHRGALPFRRKCLWAWPAFGWYALKFHKTGYMKKFYIDDYPEASLGIIAFSSVLSVLVDAFTDPRMAFITDNCKSKYGRRRPFIFASGFFVPVVFVLSWIPLVPSGTPASIWFGVFHVLFKLSDTLFLIPFDAWGGQLTPIYRERTNLWMWRDIFVNVGILCGMAVAPLLFVTDQCSSTKDTGCVQHPLIAAFFGFLHMHGCLQLAYYGREPRYEQLEQAQQSVQSVRVEEGKATSASSFNENDTIPMLMSTYLNKPFRCVLISAVSKAIGQEVPLNLLPFMTAWVCGQKCFKADLFLGILVVVNLLCGLMAVYVWMWVSACLGKYRAYVCYTLALGTSSLAFLCVDIDDGSCTMSYALIGLAAFWGASYGGSFLMKDLVSDVIDYDEFLSGGRRREANYLMAVEFIPKFMSIPGECVPFLLMAYADYQRPLNKDHRPFCSSSMANTTVSADEFCSQHYSNEPASANWCSDSKTCSSYLASGVTFVCATAEEKCNFNQNSDVRLVLRICFSIVPAVFILLSLAALYFYPKKARTEAGHETLVIAITKVKRRRAEGALDESIADPWQEGVKVFAGCQAGPNDGALSYFWPSELFALLKAAPPGENLHMTPLRVWPLTLFLASCLAIPVGGAVIAIGIDDISTDLGASVSPLGLMLVGIGLVGVWFNGARLWAAQELAKAKVSRSEVVAKYNRLCAFTGHPHLVAPGAATPIMPKRSQEEEI